MSSTGRACERVPLDAYYTPQPLADAIVERLVSDGHIKGFSAVMEPSAGAGAFARALQRYQCSVTAVDISDANCDRYGQFSQFVHADFLSLRTERFSPAAIVGNPPFSHAEEHVRHALKLTHSCGGTVAFLLRLAFLEGKKRAPFWRDHPAAHVYVLTRRPSFTGLGTDSCAYGVFVWKPSHQPTVLSHLDWSPLTVVKGGAE